MAPVRDGHSTGTVPKTRPLDNGQHGPSRPRREPFINNTPNNLDQVEERNLENGHKSSVRRSRKTSNAEIASSQLGGSSLSSSETRLQVSKENVSRNSSFPELVVRMERSGSSASSSVRGEPRRKAQNMGDRDEGAATKNINVSKMPNREEVQSRLEHLQAYIKQTSKLTEELRDKPEAHNKLVGLVAELRDSENKLRSIIRGFDAVDATNEAFNRELRDDDQKMKSVEAYAQILDSQRAALEAAANASFHNQLRQAQPSSNDSVDAATRVSSQLENIQSRIQNLHELQDNRSELAHLLGERDQQLSNEFQLVQNKLRDLHLKKALMNKLIEQVENGMPPLESNHKSSPDTEQENGGENEESDSSNDESLGEAEVHQVYSEGAASQSRDQVMEEINAKLDEAERHFLKFQNQGIVNPLSSQPADERESAFELDSLHAASQGALDTLQAQDMLSYLSESRDESASSMRSSAKRDNNSRVSSFGKNSSKAPKKVNEERISNAQLANLQSIISQVTEQYSQGLPLTDELLKSLGNQGDLVMADNENQARVLSPRDSRSHSHGSLASQCMDELQTYVSETDKRTRLSRANSSSSLDDNSACVQHNLACDHSRDLVNISQDDSSSTDEAVSLSFGERSYENKKSNAVARPGYERPSIQELQDMTLSLHQQTLGMRKHAATIANAAKEIQLLKSKLPLRDKKTNPQAVSQQMLSELQARKGEFEGLMSKHKGCSSSANQDQVSDKLQALGRHSARDMASSSAPTTWPNLPLPTSQDGHLSLNDSRSFSPISTDDQERPISGLAPVALLNNSASNLAQAQVQSRSNQTAEHQYCPHGPIGSLPPAMTLPLQQQTVPTPQQNNFWPRGNGGRMDHGIARGEATNGARMDQGQFRGDQPNFNQRNGPAEHEQGNPTQNQLQTFITQMADVIRLQQCDINMMKVTLTNLMSYISRLETQLGPGFAPFQPCQDVHMQRMMPPVLRYHEPGPAEVRSFHSRPFAPDEAMGFQDARKTLNDQAWLNPSGVPPPIVIPPWGFMQEQGATAALNNQVLPGNRSNNYHDNFRSYSRQNLLSSSIQGSKAREDQPSTSRTYHNMGVTREEPQNYPMTVVPQFQYAQPRVYSNDRATVDYSTNTNRQSASRPLYPMPMPESHVTSQNIPANSGIHPRGLGSWYPVMGAHGGNVASGSSGTGVVRKQPSRSRAIGRSRENDCQQTGNLPVKLETISPPGPILLRRAPDSRKTKRNLRQNPTQSNGSSSQASTSTFDEFPFVSLLSESARLLSNPTQDTTQGLPANAIRVNNPEPQFEIRQISPAHPWRIPVTTESGSDRELDRVPTRLDPAHPEDH